MTDSDQRFSTAHGFSRTTLTRWIARRDLQTVDEWFAQGPRHPRLAEDFLGQAAMNGWLEGVQRAWRSGWMTPNQMLITLWYNVAHFGRWKEGAPPSALEDWVVGQTWGPTDDEDLAAAQPGHRIAALDYALRYEGDRTKRWDRFTAFPLDLASAAGRDLVNTLLHQRFASKRQAIPATSPVDRCLDQVLTVPDACRAPLVPDTLLLLLWTSRAATAHDAHPQAWGRLQQLMAQSKPGLGPKDRALLACRMALIGEKAPIVQERLDHLLDRLMAWGLPSSVTFRERELGFRGTYEEARGLLRFTAPSGHPRLEAHHAGPIETTCPTLHVGDHWCYGQMRIDQPRGRDQPMTESEKLQCRGMLNVRLETRALKKAMDQVGRSIVKRRPPRSPETDDPHAPPSPRRPRL